MEINLTGLPSGLANLRSQWRRRLAVLDRRVVLSGAVLFLLFAAGMATVQFSTPDLPDNDGFYHIRFAELMRTQGIRPAFPWLPLTILNGREFYDHHLLFHAALIPFTFGDLRLGAKWAAVIFSSLAFLSVWSLLRSQCVPYAALWSLGLLAVSEAFLYRMSIPRPLSLSLAVLITGMNWLLAGKIKRLLPLAFVYVWMYDGFPLLILLAGCYVLAVWLADRRMDLRPLWYAGIGTGLGLLINPYFPNDIIFVFRHILPKLGDATAISVGNEWYPYTTGQLLKNSPLALAAFFSGVIALGLSGRRMDTRTATALLAAILFGVMLAQARRFIEYFPAFALVFAALAWTPLLERKTGSPDREPFESDWPSLGGFARTWLRRWLPAGILVLVLLPGGWMTLNAAQSSLRTSQPYGLYAGASDWLKQNTPTGSRVFQTDWDDFPRLFYYNTHNTYLVGLDPTYLQLADPGLYNLWVKITRGEVDRPSDFIYPRFGASYVLTDLKHTGFIRRAERDPGLKEVYHDGQALVFQVLP